MEIVHAVSGDEAYRRIAPLGQQDALAQRVVQNVPAKLGRRGAGVVGVALPHVLGDQRR